MLTAARLKKGTAQLFRTVKSARIFINLSWYDSIAILHKSYFIFQSVKFQNIDRAL